MLSTSPAALADDIIKVYVDGEQLSFDVDPIIENERTLVPMRAIFEALGAEVTWDQDTRTASAVKGKDTVDITIDSNILYKNGTAVELDVAAKIIDERTLVPVRAISESFNADVQWEDETRSVIITNAVQKPAAAPTPEPTSAPTSEPTAAPTTEATEQPAAGAKIQLTENDIKELNRQKEIIRYEFEQRVLPDYVFENSDSMYSAIKKIGGFSDIVYGLWDKHAAKYAMRVLLESETVYEISMADITEVTDYFSDALEAAEIDKESLFEAAGGSENENGTAVGIVIFCEADSLVQCKYLGVAVSKTGEPRYFTLENDIMDTDNWYFCEVKKEGRGTITKFEKRNDDDDLMTFMNIMCNIYESNRTNSSPSI
ncbi:MAG: hypothetical protein J1G06_10270 [Oscillospiraceae bacterium]|nr:hypothetical protein [Oscillospiraceae bacterium]